MGIHTASIGAGHVGATTAYALLLSSLTPEIVLVDLDARRAEGEAMDLMHTVPFSDPARVWAGDYEDVAGAAVVVLTAGANQRPGETRLELLARNAAILREIVPKAIARAPDAILLMTTNPVDILTWATLATSGLPPERVIGSGTILDTARFRSLLSRHFGVDARSVHAHIIGEHGDSEVAAWSIATIGGVPLADFQATRGRPLDEETRDRILSETRRAAYEIIERKGATYYAVAAGVVRIIEAILRDESTVLTVSSRTRQQLWDHRRVPQPALHRESIRHRAIIGSATRAGRADCVAPLGRDSHGRAAIAHVVKNASGLVVEGFKGFQGSRVQGFQGFRVQGFQGFRVQGFQGFRFQGFKVEGSAGRRTTRSKERADEACRPHRSRRR